MTPRPFRQSQIERGLERRAVKRYTDQEKHDRTNGEAASVILADIEHHGGEGSGLVRWARMWQERNK